MSTPAPRYVGWWHWHGDIRHTHDGSLDVRIPFAHTHGELPIGATPGRVERSQGASGAPSHTETPAESPRTFQPPDPWTIPPYTGLGVQPGTLPPEVLAFWRERESGVDIRADVSPFAEAVNASLRDFFAWIARWTPSVGPIRSLHDPWTLEAWEAHRAAADRSARVTTDEPPYDRLHAAWSTAMDDSTFDHQHQGGPIHHHPNGGTPHTHEGRDIRTWEGGVVASAHDVEACSFDHSPIWEDETDIGADVMDSPADLPQDGDWITVRRSIRTVSQWAVRGGCDIEHEVDEDGREAYSVTLRLERLPAAIEEKA